MSKHAKKDTRLYTVADIAYKVESEGLGYMVQYHTGADMIADPVLATMWEDAAQLLNQIEQYIEDNMEDTTGLDSEEDDESYD